jgi:glutaminyl-tRNA synthetase
MDPIVPKNFIQQLIVDDLAAGKNGKRVHTRFPPEPNGYLHIGHAKSICLNFGTAKLFGGITNLRFDDTNPAKEETEYVDSIMEDVKWLGFDWEDRLFYASDYFDKLYNFAVELIKRGRAYVDFQSQEVISEQRGTPTRPGIESPTRNSDPELNLQIFEDMKAGKYNEGDCVVRAKIDMSSPNMHMRDPLMYRILKQPHHRTGDKWCIYPMYDYAHGQSDYWEGITHSICTLEFEVHRPLYDWFVEELKDTDYRPRQIEFSRLNITSTVMSKRKLLQLVKEGYVKDWDDPRMPTICGLRRRGYTPESIRNFADLVGITKVDGVTDLALLEFCIREDLNRRAQRVMCVTDPLKIVLTNYPEGEVEEVDAVNNPEDESMGKRKVPFSREIYIEREDFMEEPSSKFYRLAPGKEVRLRYAYYIKCNEVIKDPAGNVVELHCTYDPETKGGNAPDGRKVKATLHWVAAAGARTCEVRLYDRLFTDPDPDGHKDKNFLEFLNPESLKTLNNCFVEPFVKNATPLTNFQFERLGYFNVDPDSTSEKLVFNRTVSLKDNSKK